MAEKIRWIAHIKSLRARHGVGIYEAERLALSDARWRRWVAHQVNSDAQCRKLALHHIAEHGTAALLYERGGRIHVGE